MCIRDSAILEHTVRNATVVAVKLKSTIRRVTLKCAPLDRSLTGFQNCGPIIDKLGITDTDCPGCFNWRRPGIILKKRVVDSRRRDAFSRHDHRLAIASELAVVIDSQRAGRDGYRKVGAID